MAETDDSRFIVDSPVGNISVQLHGATWFARKRLGGKTVWAALKTKSRHVAAARAYRFWAEKAGIKEDHLARARSPGESVYLAMYGRAKKSHEKDEAKGEMVSAYEVLALAESQGHRCALTGLSFSVQNKNSFRAPLAPSLDRINCRKGYVTGNIRIVCTAVNWALSDWGDGVFDKICRSYVARTDAIERAVTRKPKKPVTNTQENPIESTGQETVFLEPEPS